MKIANVELESRDLVNGKCLELINCRGAELSGSTLTCLSPGSDAAPYPDRSLKYHSISIALKGTVSRDFLLLVFFLKPVSPKPLIIA